MHNKLITLAVVVAAAVTGLVLASVVVAQSGSAPDPPRGEPDATPASNRQVSASTRAPDGATLGVVTYRNEAGRLCMAQGHVRGDGVLADKGGRELPYREVGDCSVTPDPVTVGVTSVSNDS